MSWIVTTGTKKILGLAQEKIRLKAVFGGASASKTYSIIPVLIDRAITESGCVITVVSDTARNLRDGAMRDFQNIMKSTNRWDRAGWNKTESKYTFKGGSIMEFLGADEPDKFRGPRRDYLYVNEANRISYETFDQMDSRTRKEVWLDWNPTEPFWYDTEIKDRIPCKSIRLTYLDNESLSPGEVERFESKKALAMLPEARRYDVNWWRVYGLGVTGQIDGACITDFKECDGIMEGYKLVGIGLDFGDVDPNAGVALYKNEHESFIFDEILYKSKISMDTIADSLRPYDTWVYADYGFPQTINYLRSKGHNVVKCKKGPDSIKIGINLLNEKEIFITKRSENLMNEFNSYRRKKDKDGLFMENKYEGPDHLVDACRYVLRENVQRLKAELIFF